MSFFARIICLQNVLTTLFDGQLPLPDGVERSKPALTPIETRTSLRNPHQVTIPGPPESHKILCYIRDSCGVYSRAWGHEGELFEIILFDATTLLSTEEFRWKNRCSLVPDGRGSVHIGTQL